MLQANVERRNPKPGDIVRARSRVWLVEDVRLPTGETTGAIVRLSCLQDDSVGEDIEVLWDHEIDARAAPPRDWPAVVRRGFAKPREFSAFMHALRWSSVTSTKKELLQAPDRAGIDVKAYQLEPLRRALQMPRVSLFIADDVGLGKTIEAGLILRELLIRQKVKRCVVACPPAVVLQWRNELEQRFGLPFIVMDREYVRRIRQERGYAHNPWSTHARFIVSHALLRDADYTGPLRAWLGEELGPALLILDEAHHAAPSHGSKYAVDSALTQTIEELAPLFRHRLFLSATPHNGHANSFGTLLSLLDPQRFLRGVPVGESNKEVQRIVVRRLKKDLQGVADEFPERQPVRVELKPGPDAPEIALSRMLERYGELREDRLADSAARRAAANMVHVNLQKRLLSSIPAFLRTLGAHDRWLDKHVAGSKTTERLPEPAELDAPDQDDPRSDAEEAAVEARSEAAMAAVTGTLFADALPDKTERALLDEMLALARANRREPDARVAWLDGWIRENLCQRPNDARASWAPKRLLVFTEYTDTKDWLLGCLRGMLGDDVFDARVATFHGGMQDEARQRVVDAFNEDPTTEPLRILVCTDAAREGVNLQNHCADLVHFDVPWNPARMEQRNGRIDRRLQRAKVVRCHYFVLPERVEDHVLEVLVQKTTEIVRELGSFPPVLQRALDGLLTKGLRKGQIDGLAKDIQLLGTHAAKLDPLAVTAEKELESTRKRQQELAREVARLEELLAKSREWLAIDERHVRDALDVALTLESGHGLTPASAEPDDRPGLARFTVPADSDGAVRGSAWQELCDTLRRPRRPREKLNEWRDTAPIRPVVFMDPGTVDGKLAHVHLEHRFTRRLLDRFLAQGFQDGVVKRACVMHTRQSSKRIVVLARLSLHGDGAARLHDLVVPVCAEWVDPAIRTGKLKPLAMDRDEIFAALDDAFSDTSLHEVPIALQSRLLEGAERDIVDLKSHLEKQLVREQEAATKELEKRGLQEAKELTAILEAQRDEITFKLSDRDESPAQLSLVGLEPEEREQREADRRAWRRRLERLPDEIEKEPERIRRSYEARTVRIEPMGVVYLWPRSS